MASREIDRHTDAAMGLLTEASQRGDNPLFVADAMVSVGTGALVAGLGKREAIATLKRVIREVRRGAFDSLGKGI